RVVSASATMSRIARDASLTADEVLDAAQKEMLAVVEQRSVGALVQVEGPLKTVFKDIERVWQHRMDHGAVPIGLPTGLTDFDAMTNGLSPDDLVIVAARPS